MNKSGLINLHQEALYLQGARDMLMSIERSGMYLSSSHTKDDAIYSRAVFEEILHNRESLVKFLQGSGWRYYDHQHKGNNPKNKLISVKVKMNE